MEDPSGDFSEGLDEFEESMDDHKNKHGNQNRNQMNFKDKPYDEAYELSQDLSMAESFDGRGKQNVHSSAGAKVLKNDKYDEAEEVSQSLDPNSFAAAKTNSATKTSGKMATDSKDNKTSRDTREEKGMSRNTDQTRSQNLSNGHFDEALEFSQSGSEESVDTTQGKPRGTKPSVAGSSAMAPQQSSAPKSTSYNEQPIGKANNSSSVTQLQKNQPAPSQQQKKPSMPSPDKSEASASEEGDAEESYDHIEGAYNPRDFAHLSVAGEVKDLFQYIERYKPQEVDIDAPLKCFIPEFIPSIGELDPFLKVPRPDGKEDGCGLRYLDEPASNQSDPTVLELQLRAKSKKLQYGDVVVRSIENADKNPSKIEKWIQDISDLHRSKPPPNVNYRRNMPDIDRLMEVWPEDFEKLLSTTLLPSPDLDLTLPEYAKVLCSILDIPTYDNPLESLHVMFSLYVEMKNNPHFQDKFSDRAQADAKGEGYGSKYGGADVLQIEDDYKS